ncbi:MAG: biotin--[acetyl-CoA-carboxylase] ligase [Dehalococcoidia bacterium]|nr:biotin--[acetyl-CoA-carboxylase] ligase [Dehalococcoidia bacterium]
MAEIEFTEHGITSGLNTIFMGQTLRHYSLASSTMDIAREEAHKKMPEGTTIIADQQTAGRGRLQRQWEAPAGSSVLLSVVLYPNPQLVTSLTMIGCLAVVYAIEEATGLSPAIKWPNDVLINGKKVCGVIVESEFLPDGGCQAILGVGLNVNFNPSMLSDVIYPATTLSAELGREVSRVVIVQSLLRSLERLYLSAKESRPLHEEWKQHLDTIGKPVRVTQGNSVEEGIAEGVNSDGSLVLRRRDGTTTTIIAGDVTLRG